MGKLTPRPAGVVETGVPAAREGVKQAHGQAGGVNICSLSWKLGHRWGGMFALWPWSMLFFFTSAQNSTSSLPRNTLHSLAWNTRTPCVPVGKEKKKKVVITFVFCYQEALLGEGGGSPVNNNRSPEKDKYIPWSVNERSPLQGVSSCGKHEHVVMLPSGHSDQTKPESGWLIGRLQVPPVSLASCIFLNFCRKGWQNASCFTERHIRTK